jgi:hypothetical protein
MKFESHATPLPKTRTWWGGLFVLSLGLLAAGCGSGNGNVSGKVLYQGKPLTTGAVTFFPSSGAGAFISRIEQDGSYRVEKVPVGNAKIAIHIPPAKRARDRAPQSPQQSMVQDIKSGKVKISDETRAKLPSAMKKDLEAASSTGETGPIPAQYSDPEKSGLEYMVTGGSHSYNIELK